MPWLKLMFFFSLLQVTNYARADESKIYQQDAIGNIQHHKTSSITQMDGRIIQSDSLGNKLYHKQQYRIKDGKIYETDSIGNIQYHKQHAVIFRVD